MLNLLLVLLGCVTAFSQNLNSTSNLQATWLPTSYNFNSEQSVFDMMSSLQKEGVRRVYVDVWNQGKVYFSSPTMRNVVGASGEGDDYLDWALTSGESLGIEVYAWFEYGLMPSYGSINNDFARYAESSGWILGQYNGFFWLDPRNSDVIAFLGNIMLDAVNGYASKGLKGVQLDDHFASPVSLGRTAADMDAAAAYIRSVIPASTPTSPAPALSLSPSTLSFSISTYNVDWNKWGQSDYYDEVIPQIYRTTFASFKSEFDHMVLAVGDSTQSKWVGSGIRVDGSGDSTAWPEVNDMIEYCTSHRQGAVVWYARGILETYPSNFQSVWA